MEPVTPFAGVLDKAQRTEAYRRFRTRGGGPAKIRTQAGHCWSLQGQAEGASMKRGSWGLGVETMIS